MHVQNSWQIREQDKANSKCSHCVLFRFCCTTSATYTKPFFQYILKLEKRETNKQTNQESSLLNKYNFIKIEMFYRCVVGID